MKKVYEEKAVRPGALLPALALILLCTIIPARAVTVDADAGLPEEAESTAIEEIVVPLEVAPEADAEDETIETAEEAETAEVSATAVTRLKDENGALLNGMYRDEETHIWYYYVDGIPDMTFTGMAKNQWGWWYFENGQINFSYTGMAKNDWGWWYFENGRINFSYTGMAKNPWGWWYFEDGRINFSYTGVGENQWGAWYFEKGQIAWSYTGVATVGKVKYNVVKGQAEKVDKTKSGMYKVCGVWSWLNKGVRDEAYTGMAKNDWGWWYFEDGYINFNYTGYGRNDWGLWYFENGRINFSYTGWADGSEGVWYFIGGQGQFSRSDTKVSISWNSSWQYASNSATHATPVTLYRSTAEVRKNKTVCVNAGHGSYNSYYNYTLCHPDGSPKVTGGSTAAGAVSTVGVTRGTVLLNGTTESDANLALALLTKDALLAAGYDVLMIRETADVDIDNVARTVYANNLADCHIAIHYNSSSTNKGLFYISVPQVSSYLKMEPVASHWKEHNRLGESIITGMSANNVKIANPSSMAIDLTQTSYSTVPSVDVEVGDRASSFSQTQLKNIAAGFVAGLDNFFAF